MRKSIAPGLLGAGAILLAILLTGCSDEPSPTPLAEAVPTPTVTAQTGVTPAPTPAPTLAPTDILTPEPTPATATLPLGVYLTLCAPTDIDLADDATYGDFSSVLAAEADRFEALTPPAQLSEWHLLNIEAYRTAQAGVDTQPKDDVLVDNPTINAAESAFIEKLREAAARVPKDVLQRMIEAGCIDPDVVPDDHGNDFESATRIAIGEAVAIELNGSDDKYVLVFLAEPEAVYVITLQLDGASMRFTEQKGPIVALYDAGGQELARLEEDDSRQNKIMWQAVTGGDYYIVVGDGATAGTFELTVNVEEATEPVATPAPTAPPVATPAPTAPPTPPEDSFVSVSAGGYHTCGLRSDGSVACWGSDLHGRSTPPVGSFVSVSAGDLHTCGVRSDGSVACWGNNYRGKSTPPVGSFDSVSAGWDHTCGVKSDGSVACWGDNFLRKATPPVGSFDSVSGGGHHTCGVRSDGSVACWGSDLHGQSTPPVGSFVSVSAGDLHTCGVRSDGSVACWGNNEYGQATPPAGSFDSVSAGDLHTCGVRSDGSVACWGSDHDYWGSDYYGQATPPAGSFDSVSAGGGHTCGLGSDGSVACWGNHEYGQATPPVTPTAAPTSTPTPEPTPAAATLSLDEYLTHCVTTELELADDATFGDLSSDLAAEEDRFEALTPPVQLSEWHLLNIEGFRTIQAFVELQPKDDVIDFIRFFLMASISADSEEKLSEAASRLPEDVLQQMIEAGCIDPEDLPSVIADGSDDHGDDIDDATAIRVGVGARGAVDYEGDVDYFRFQAERGQSYQIDVALGSLDDSIVEMYDSDGLFLDSNDDYSGNTASRLLWQASSSGELYVAVAAFGSGVGTYTLTVTLSTIVDDHGDDIDDATAIRVGTDVPGVLDYVDDIDYFRFQAEQGQSYQIDVTLGSLDDSIVELHDYDGLFLDSNDDYSGSTASRLSWQASSSGELYVAVAAFGSGIGTYTLTVSLIGDHGNDFESATRIGIGKAVAIELENLDDMEVLVFRLAPDREYVFTLDWETYQIWDNPVSIMALYDASGQLLARLNDYDFSAQRIRNKITWQAVTGGDYYIVVGDENTLRLRCLLGLE